MSNLSTKGVDLPILKNLFETLELIGYLGIYLCVSVRDLFTGRVNLREFWFHAYECTYNSVFIVIIANMVIGMVSALQLTKHFMAFGFLSEIGGTNAMALIREMSPLFTAIVLIGRIGSAWAAEIGSMKMTEQIDALKVMKIKLPWFLINPRVLACMFATPILNAFAVVFGIFGGYLVAFFIADLSLSTYLDSIQRYMDLYDWLSSMSKAIVFGWLIASTACALGLKAEGGALGVGRYTTKAVVFALLAVFVANYLLSYFFYSILK